MQFTPKTEKQIAEENLWPVGKYDFEVIEKTTFAGKDYYTCDTFSKKENEMIVLVLKVYNPEGKFRIILDYLVESVAYKLRHAAFACGLGSNYESGTLRALDFVGKAGELELKTKKDEEGKYPDKNAVSDYVVKTADDNAAPPKANNVGIDDEIPFM